jgi:serine/threonine protein kinase
MLNIAEQNEARERLRALQPSAEILLPNGVHDENKHPYGVTQARFGFRRRLGGGSFGEVDEVQEMSTGAVYVRKLIHCYSGSSRADFESDVLNEVAIMQKLRHQHIATVLFYVKDPNAYSILMLPVADCDLLCYLQRCIEKGYPMSSVKRIYPWFGCLLDALAYAHKLNIKHRDIKPSNILIKDGQPYLADFGIAKDFTAQDMSASRDYFVQGTPVYRAPETRPEYPRGRRADMFALGCVFSEMLTVNKRKSLDAFRKWRLAPENTTGVYAFRANLAKVKEWLLSLERDALSDLLVEQISTMLHEDPEERPTAQESLNFLKRERALFCSSHW